MGVKPPGVMETWDKCNFWIQAKLLAYWQLRDYENQEETVATQKLLAGRM